MKAIVYGVGKMGVLISRYMVEKGVDIVGAIDMNPAIVGKDLGEVAGLGRDLNVIIRKDADEVLSEYKADIAIVAVYTDMERMYPIFKRCIKNNLNVITLSEEALYPWGVAPEFAARLDRLARDHGVTITASGLQDTLRVNLVTLLTGASHFIESIFGIQRNNLGGYGKEVLSYYHVGESEESVRKKLTGIKQRSGSFRMTLEALAADLGLTIMRVEERPEPTIAEMDIEVASLEGIVKKGFVTGMKKVINITTREKIILEGEQILKVYNEDELKIGDINEWFVHGIPEVHLKNDRVSSDAVTCAQLVNRIPDVIRSAPGYVTVDLLPKLKYRAFPLSHYLEA